MITEIAHTGSINHEPRGEGGNVHVCPPKGHPSQPQGNSTMKKKWPYQDMKAIRRDMRTPSCVICGSTKMIDKSHIKSRGSGGPNTSWNVYPKCRACHIEWHQLGKITFLQKHPEFWQILKYDGWYMLDGRLWHDGLSGGVKNGKLDFGRDKKTGRFAKTNGYEKGANNPEIGPKESGEGKGQKGPAG